MFSLGPLTLTFVFNGALAAALALYAARRQDMRGARPFVALNVLAAAISWVCAAYAEAHSPAARNVWFRLRQQGE